MLKRPLQLLFFVLLLAFGCTAQEEPDDTDVQSFNEVQLTAPMAKKVDFQAVLALRFGRDLQRLTDQRVTVGLVFRPTSSFSASSFYGNFRSLNAAGQFRQEHRFSVRANLRRDFRKFSLTHRSTYEYRLRRDANAQRYRAMFGFERDLSDNYRLIISNEVYYNSVSGRFSRNRFAVGVAREFGRHLTTELTYMRQNDGFSRPGDLNVIWVTWRIRP